MSRFFSKTGESSRGFTLIELLVVIAIIGILSSVVLASLNSARTKARDTRRISDIKQIQIALELYFDANGKYATKLSDLVTSGGLAGASLSALPVDPSGAAVNVTTGYKYAIDTATPAKYHLGATLEQAPAQTTLEDADRDFVSSSASPAWVTSLTDSIPFSGTDTITTAIYDVSNQ
jgi:general secretion pathway protein G